MKRLCLSSEFLTALLLTITCTCALTTRADDAIRHVTVYQQKDMFCGWPANNGAWSWGHEILVCFDLHHFKEPDFDIDYTDHHYGWQPESQVGDGPSASASPLVHVTGLP